MSTEVVKSDVHQLDMFGSMNTEKYMYKSNNLIESSYKLSINAHRLILLAIRKLKPLYIKSDIKPSEFDTLAAHIRFSQLKIYTTEFKSVFNLKGNATYESLAKAAYELQKAEINYFNSIGEYVVKSWVTECDYNKEENYVKIIFNPSLILDLLLFKNNYSRLLTDATLSFKSVYHIRTYELLKRSFINGSLTISVEDYRFKLAIPDDKYANFGKLKNKIIEPAIKTINEKSDIFVYDFKTIKQGRTVKTIIFYMKESNNVVEVNESIRISDEIGDKECIEKTKTLIPIELDDNTLLRISDITLRAVIEKNKSGGDITFSEYLLEKVHAVDQYGKMNDIRNYPGTLIAAIKGDWKFIEKDRSDPGFNNFTPRSYDYDDLEKKLLGWDKD